MMKHPSYNASLICDYYEYTMANGYLKAGLGDRILYFDIYFRKVPDGGGFCIAAGLEQVIEYVKNLHFGEDDIEFFRSKNVFSEEFLEELRNFRFTGDIWAVPEGTPVFPNEPIVTVRARAVEAQMLETFLLLTLNHQTLIATKANRIVRASQGRAVLEFGSRRAQGPDAATLGARASYIAGCAGTACTLSDKLYGVPASGTMAHSWIQLFGDEYTAFKTYCETYPHNASLLVDTYNVLKSGIPNAIRVFKEVLLPRGITNCSVRIDSGDIAYLSQKAREMLDEAGLPFCKIVASNSLDENLIRDLIMQDGKVDLFGVGERMITASSDPVLGGVYKLVAVEEDGKILPRIKVSENVAKITTPGFKKVYRIFDCESNKAAADLICLHDEQPDFTKPLELFDPEYTWKRKVIEDYTVEELLVPIFRGGELVYDLPSLEEIRTRCRTETDRQWAEVKRFENPHNYYVDLSEKLWQLKKDMMEEYR